MSFKLNRNQLLRGIATMDTRLAGQRESDGDVSGAIVCYSRAAQALYLSGAHKEAVHMTRHPHDLLGIFLPEEQDRIVDRTNAYLQNSDPLDMQ